MSCVTCHLSCVPCHFYFKFFLHLGWASRWRVCYQRGLPRLVNRPDVAGAVLQTPPSLNNLFIDYMHAQGSHVDMALSTFDVSNCRTCPSFGVLESRRRDSTCLSHVLPLPVVPCHRDSSHVYSHGTALHRGLSKYLTAQDTRGTPTLTKQNRTPARIGNLLSLQPGSTLKVERVFFCP